MTSKHIMYKQDWNYRLCVCVCVCVWCSLLSETLSWSILKGAWEVSLFIEWVDVIG